MSVAFAGDLMKDVEDHKQKGGTLQPQTGEYLQDSFRCESFVPAFSAVEQELKHLITTDHWHMIGMLIISGIGFIGNILLTWKIKLSAQGTSMKGTFK